MNTERSHINIVVEAAVTEMKYSGRRKPMRWQLTGIGCFYDERRSAATAAFIIKAARGRRFRLSTLQFQIDVADFRS